MDALADALTSSLGATPIDVRRLSGGDNAASYRFALEDGRVVFAKTHPAPPAGFFEREAVDLDWLRAADALPVPDVLAVSDGRTTGSLALPNEPTNSWSEFYAQRRLFPLARIAGDRNALQRSDLDCIEQLADRLVDVGGPAEPPARLHGDLWAGNCMTDVHGVSWMIDPASHGGHREFDLAMMRLFGGFGAGAFDAYDEVFPLADGWQRRVPLHQLAPLVVHAINFGGSYVAAVSEALDTIG